MLKMTSWCKYAIRTALLIEPINTEMSGVKGTATAYFCSESSQDMATFQPCLPSWWCLCRGPRLAQSQHCILQRSTAESFYNKTINLHK